MTSFIVIFREPNEVTKHRKLAYDWLKDVGWSFFVFLTGHRPNCLVLMHRWYFFLPRLDMDTLIRFTLSVRKGYRPVAYHNWAHAFAVAHSMCVIMKMASDIFTCEEVRYTLNLVVFVNRFCLFVCMLVSFKKKLLVQFNVFPSLEILYSAVGIKFN